MPEPFKTFINAELVRRSAAHLSRAEASFDAARFLALATDGLEALELKARAMQVADALEATLPGDFHAAADVLERALAPASEDDRMASLTVDEHGLAGWIIWPVGEFVARRGLAHPERALRALHALTQRFSAEFAIRPFIVAHPALVFRTLTGWVHDDSAHVRRLVSEGSRPRLPWGIRLQALVRDPSPTLPLLAALQDDLSAYVRRSVANHLNDIAKDHPALVADWLEQHLPHASAERRALLKHASRTLIKQGDARVLHAWGVGAPFNGTVHVHVAPPRITVGEHVEITVTVRSTSRRLQRLAVDYAVHFVKADGRTSPKVFKGWAMELGAGEQRVLVKRHSMKRITTRRYYAGEHRVEVQVNGAVVGAAAFTLIIEGDDVQRSDTREATDE